jgi:tyrosine-protein kinase Etk/Wzc
VIILDLDMRKPKIHLGFGVENIRGMSTVLIGKDDHGRLHPAEHPEGLDFITAGPIPPNPSELIISPRMSGADQRAARSYDMVLIDNPPVGLVTDGIPMIQLADYPIYIFRSDYSKKQFVQNVDRLINENSITRPERDPERRGHRPQQIRLQLRLRVWLRLWIRLWPRLWRVATMRTWRRTQERNA